MVGFREVGRELAIYRALTENKWQAMFDTIQIDLIPALDVQVSTRIAWRLTASREPLILTS